jgi:hypothetical protein
MAAHDQAASPLRSVLRRNRRRDRAGLDHVDRGPAGHLVAFGRDASGQDRGNADQGEHDRDESGELASFGAGFDRLDLERDQDVVPEFRGHEDNARLSPAGADPPILNETYKSSINGAMRGTSAGGIG